MRILLTAFACNPGQGSEPGNGWNWARCLAQRGHDVDLVTCSDGRGGIEAGIDRLGLATLYLHLVDAERRWPVPHAEARRLAGYEAWLTACGRHVRQLPRPDLAHHVTWGSLHFGPCFRGLGAPVVTGPVGGGQIASARHRAYFDGEWRDELVRTIATSTFLPMFPGARRTARSDHVFATNRATEMALRRLGARSVSLLLAEGVEPAFITDDHRALSANPVFVWVGSMVPRKAARLALEAFSRVAVEVPGASMVFVGDGRGMPVLRQRVDVLGLVGRVMLTGRVPWSQVGRYLDAADCFVFSSLRDSSSAQCLEAAARGVPIVAFDLDGICDFLPDQAVVKARVDTPDLPGSLAAAMSTAVADPGRWERARARAIAWARENTWDQKVVAAERIYERLAG